MAEPLPAGKARQNCAAGRLNAGAEPRHLNHPDHCRTATSALTQPRPRCHTEDGAVAARGLAARLSG
ncbi:MAG: hypothetical protein Q8L84_11485, partial [Hyphomonas sp.]|nr:hypothetical protein [Hyphomonas sp.]